MDSFFFFKRRGLLCFATVGVDPFLPMLDFGNVQKLNSPKNSVAEGDDPTAERFQCDLRK